MAQILSWIGGIALTVILPRYLGDVNLGKFAVAFAFTQLIGLMADLGSGTYLTKEVARNRAAAASLVMDALGMRLPLMLAAVAVTIVGANLAGYDPITKQIVYVLSLGIVVGALANLAFGTLQGLQQMTPLAVNSVLTRLGYAGLAALLLVGGGGPVEVAVAWVTSLLLGLVLGVWVLLRLVRLSPRIDWRASRCILLGGLPFFVWQAALMVYGQVDSVLLAFLAHDAVVGWYSAAYRIVTIPVFLPTIIVTVVFPALSAAATDHRTFNRIARRAVHVVALVGIPMALGIMLLPDKLIAVLRYPESFNNSTVPLMLLALSIPLIGVDMVIGTVLNTRDRQRQWAMTAVAAAVLNPTLNILAISHTQAAYGNGAIGAAAITTLTEVFMMAVGLRLLPRGVFDGATLRGVLKCLAAGTIMAVCVWATRDYLLIVPVLAGALVYGGSCFALGIVTGDDVKKIALHVSGHPSVAGVR